MARPDPDTISISHGLESWDTAIESKFDLVFDTPLPLAIYADFASLPDATAYENCLAVAEDTNDLYISDGADWILVGVTTFLGLSDTPSSYTGQGGKILAVNVGEDALEFVSPAAGGKGFTGKDYYTDFSTSETDTGLAWTDGKKIYQKVIAIAALPNAAGSPTLLQTAHSVDGITKFIDAWGYAKNAAGETIPLPYIHSASAGYGISLAVDATYINTRGYGADFSGYSGHVVIQYTKSTDGAASTDWPSYSATEQVTGRKHINGKPIYRKSFVSLAGPYNTLTTFNHEISNIEDVVALRGVITSSATVDGIVVPGYSDNNGVNRACWIYATSSQIGWQTTTTDFSGRTNSHIHIEYTKSTDQGVDTSSLLGKDLSFEEVNTGNKWIDGKWIYKKVVQTGTGPNAVGIGHVLNIPNLDQVLRIRGTAANSSDHVGRMATPLFYTFGASKHIKYTVQGTKLTMATQASANMTQITDEILTVLYTKTITTPQSNGGVIRANLTLYVVASGGSSTGDGSLTAPFDTIQSALLWLADKLILPTVTVTISVGAGTYTSTSTLYLHHPNASRINITGYTTAGTNRTINGVNTGTKTFTVNGVDCRTEFPAGAVCKVFGSTLNDGTFTVASNGYSGGNTTVVVNETIRSSTADGSIIGYGLVNRILAFTDVGGLNIFGDFGLLDGFIISGNGGGSAQVGVDIKRTSSVTMGNNIVIKGFSGIGLNISEASALTAGDIVVTANAGNNLQLSGGSTATFTPVSTRGAAFCRSSAARGAYITYNSSVLCLYMIATENQLSNVECFIGGLIVANTGDFNYSVAGAGINLRSGSKGYFLSGPSARYNGANGVHVLDGSHCNTTTLVATHNTGYGILVNGQSSHSLDTTTLSDNTVGDASPAISTEGNSNSLNYGS